MDSYRETFAEVLPRVQIHDQFHFTWYGRTYSPVTAQLRKSLTSDSTAAFFQNAVRDHLYRNLYCAGRASAGEMISGAGGAMPASTFVQELSMANAGRGMLSPGWRILKQAGSALMGVGPDGVRFWIEAQDVNGEPGDGSADSVFVRLPKGMRGISPGFYMAYGDTPDPDPSSRSRIRLYWNVSFTGAVPLMARLTQSLNDGAVAFQFKVLSHPDHYDRCDAAVLYVHARDYERTAECLAGVHAAVTDHLKSRVPFLTKQLAPGLGLAEEPVSRESFGQSRMRLTARGLIDAHHRGCDTSDGRLRMIEASFDAEGISLDTPFLGSGSTDCYAFDLRCKSTFPVGSAKPTSNRDTTALDITPGQALEVARGIAASLVDEAVWYQDRCTWVGAHGHDRYMDLVTSGLRYETVQGDLYGGASGIAWFLAELAAKTGDPAVHRTAVAALTNSLAKVEEILPSARRSLFAGATGVAVAAVHAGLLLDEPDLVERGFAVAERAATLAHADEEADVLLGTAGAIVGWLMLHSTRASATLIDAAVRAGEQLLGTAVISARGWSWKSQAFPKQQNLTGFSHGAGGIACALLELDNAIGERAFRQAALEAFRYEQSHFVAEEQNWKDLRMFKAARRRHASRAFATQWCHGAPGIALSRIRAARLIGDAALADQARTGLHVTARNVAEGLESRTAGYCLCHGQAGNAEVLRIGQGILLRDERARMRATVAAVAAQGMEISGLGNTPWPCGTSGGKNPSLFLGTAGIGLFYLRCVDPTLITPLLFEADRPLGAPGRPTRAE